MQDPVPPGSEEDNKYILLSNGLIATKDGRILVPLGKRKEILELNHNHKLAGHGGIARTLARLRDRFTWSNMTSDVITHVQNCLICAKRKSYGATKAPLQPIPIQNQVMHTMAADIWGPVAESRNGHKYVLVVTEYATRYVITIPMIDQTARTVATHLVNNVFTIFASPTQFLTDQGTQFKSELLRTICELFGIKQINTTTYHAQTDGLTERFNRTMADMLTSYVAQNQGNWDQYLRYITLAYNVGRHASTKYAPFTLFYGREASLPTDIIPPLRYRSTENQEDVICQQWSLALKIARDNLLHAQLLQKKYYDDKTMITQYKGDLILLREPSRPGKFIMMWEGPHRILRNLSDLTYQIEDVKKLRVQIVHVNRMKKWKIADETDQQIITNQEGQICPTQNKNVEQQIQDSAITVPPETLTEKTLVDNKKQPRIVIPTENGTPEFISQHEINQSIIGNPSKNKKGSNNDSNKRFEVEKSVDQVKRKRGRPRKTELIKSVDIQKPRDIEQPIGRYNLRQHPKQTRF